ncbi:hypothetical protein Ga0076813_11134 [endosymbiont of Ridgeia piscesae]|uniref:Response regulatory domain-containing protein n=1 Tax=endosymbiont of Ridgeia piscesae TaxID=54398 RepID=A0A0T5Z2Q8_9GAMM|nr:hypothetical protein Ga0076813_11134 [endosymbiont of Ridgeia piscesae]
MAKRIRPSLILMDVVMPVLNGFQATRQLLIVPKVLAVYTAFHGYDKRTA